MTHLPEMMLAGITVRTNNLSEMDPAQAKIGATIHQYFSNGISNIIPNRLKPGVTYCVYTDYASDHSGDYTYFVGEVVSSADNIPNELSTITIPSQQYKVFTNEPGPMPDVCIQLWNKIWNTEELATCRTYQADFEVYDERAMDPRNTVLDVYVGVR